MSGLHFAEFFHMPIVLSAFSVLSLTFFVVQYKYCRSKKNKTIDEHEIHEIHELENGQETNMIHTSSSIAHSGGAGRLTIDTNVHSI